jgi:Helix-turn-helix domain
LHVKREAAKQDEKIRDHLVTIAEVGEELRLKPRSVRYRIYSNQLQALRMGKRRLRVTREALDTFRREHLQPV